MQARPGYFAAARRPAPERRVDREFASATTLAEAPVRVDVHTGKLPSGGAAVQVRLWLDAGKLRFEKRSGRHQQKLTFLAGLFDPQGNFVTGKEGQIDFSLKDATLPQMTSEGFSASLTLPASPGRYQVRAVVEEGLDGKVTASTQAAAVE